ncbi:unnamed protein product, partial [Owenia fusiformis]
FVIFCGAYTLHMFLHMLDMSFLTDADILGRPVFQKTAYSLEIPQTHASLTNTTKESTIRNVKQNEADHLQYVKQNEADNLQYVKQNEYNQTYVKYNKYYRLIETLSSAEIVDYSEVSLSRGWWSVKEEYWTKYTDCFNGSCKIAFAVQCLSKLRALYQYIPIRKLSPIRGVYFSVCSINKILIKRDDLFGYHYGAMALLKFTDGSNHTIQLQFSPQEGHQQQSNVYMLPID